MHIVPHLQNLVADQLAAAFDLSVDPGAVIVNVTKREFEGDYTVVLFPFVKQLKTGPEQLGQQVGDLLVKTETRISGFNVVKGFLNLTLTDAYWRSVLENLSGDWWAGDRQQDRRIMIEFSSPNTNKPLHLGHIRNILLGWSMAQIYAALGYKVIKTQIVNDRGIAICKSMLAWQLFANGSTPESTGVKGDHFVGDWYVRFEKEFQDEYKAWQASDAGRKAFDERLDRDMGEAEFFKAYKNRYFNTQSALGAQARNMLLRWEAGDPDTLELWHQMNTWVYRGFDETYRALGVEFDKLYFESETYLLGKKYVEQGLSEGKFYRKEDGSIWVDLTEEGLDEKVLLRSDGTSVYITQDIGTAQKRFEDFGVERMVYVVADEQNYHFQALFATLKKLGVPYADGLHHLSYGMVDLPTGKMKSREGTVVDADDLIADVIREAGLATADRGEIAELPPDQQTDIVEAIALGALKYFILKVDAKKRMTFNPAESLDMQGQTGPYIQNAYVRIQSILRKADSTTTGFEGYELLAHERQLLTFVMEFASIVQQAANQYDTSGIAHYLYDLAKDFHRYYHDVSVLKAESDAARAFRLGLIGEIANVLEAGMSLLGIEMPDRM